MVYLSPSRCPAEQLRLHYGVEITFPEESGADSLVEIVGYDDARYFRQMWKASSAHNSVGGGGGLSLDALPGGKREPLTYSQVRGEK